MMNIKDIGAHQKFADANDYERLMEICNSYGLDKEETQQILSEFKNGTYHNCDNQNHNHNYNQKSPQDCVNYKHHSSVQYQESFSKQNQLQPQGNYGFKNQSVKFEEQYSFKHHNNVTAKSPKRSNKFSLENSQTSEFNPNLHHFGKKFDPQSFSYSRSNNQSKQNQQCQQEKQNTFKLSQADVQEFFANRLQFQKQIYHDLKLQNQRITEQNKLKDQKISVLMEFKYKDSDLIMGLKNIIADLTNQSKEKDARYIELQNKYEFLLSGRQQSSRRSSSYFDKQNSKKNVNAVHSKIQNRLQQHPIIPICTKIFKNQHFQQKDQFLNQIQSTKNSKQNINLFNQIQSGKTSNQNIVGTEKRQIVNPQSNLQKQPSKNKLLKDQLIRRNNRIDISKYKGMIQELRNSYHKEK